MLAGLTADAGEIGNAIVLHEEAITVARGDEEAASVLPVLLHNLGYAYERSGDYERAREAFEEALDLESPASIGRAITLESLGALRLYDGRPEEARPLVAEAVSCGHAAGVTSAQPHGIGLLAAVDAATGHADRAVRLLGWTQRATDESGEALLPHLVAVYESALATAREQLGEDELERLLQEGRRMTTDEAVALALGDPDLS